MAGGGGGSAAALNEAIVAGIVASGAGAAEGEFSSAKTSVWWDIENCQVPRGCDPHVIAKNISTALADMGYKGIVSSISAYGDTNNINNSVQQALHSTGVNLNHIPTGVKDASDKKILVDMLFWAIDNPPPANILLISGDRDFSNALHQLRRRRYNILLAHAPNVSQALVAAAKCVWLWTNLLAGGSPLNTELSQSFDNSLSNAEASQVSERKQNVDPPKSTQSLGNGRDPPKSTRSQVNGRDPPKSTQSPANGKVDKKPSWKACKPSNNPNLRSPEIASQVPGSLNSQHSKPQGNQLFTSASSSTTLDPMQSKGTAKSVSDEPQEPGGTKLNFYAETSSRQAPQNYFEVDNHITSSAPPATNGSSNNQRCPPQLLKPSDLRPQIPLSPASFHRSVTTASSPPSFPENAYSQPLSYGENRFSLPGATLPDVNRLSILEHPRGLKNQDMKPNTHSHTSGSTSHSNQPNVASSFTYASESKPSAAPRFNGKHYNDGPSRMAVPGQTALPTPTDCGLPYGDADQRTTIPPQPSNEAQFHIGNILLALHTLRTEKVLPTEENIAGCIHYGEKNLPYFDVRLGLDYALRYNAIVKLNLSASLTFYHRRNERLWDCVNIMDGSKHPKATWDTVKAFLMSSSGFSAISSSKCRYQAALIMKKNCFPDRIVGEVLQILHSVINTKKWLLPSHPNGWQPLTIKLPVVPVEAQLGVTA